VNFTATASDLDGSIAKVEFYVDGGKVGEDTTPPYATSWTATGGIHICVARAIDNSLGVTTSSSVTIFVTTPVTQGLKAEYFVNPENWTNGPAGVRIDSTVNFSDSAGWPANTGFPGITSDNFSVRWTGQIHPPTSGSYTFYINSDDGSFLYLDNNLVINNGGYHAPVELSYTVNLNAGQLYRIRMDMFEGGGGAVAQLSWSGPGIAKQIIPQSALYPESAPIIITQPLSLTREQGTSATFTVAASGVGNAYQWLKGGVAINGATSASYTLPFVLPSDAGSYTVLISNSGGFAASNAAMLTVTVTDVDNDGMQDSWETANGFNPANAADALLDTDGDGQINRQEYLAGTDPRSPGSVLRMSISKLGDGWHVGFTAQPYRSYTIRYRNALTDSVWTKLQDVTPASGVRQIDMIDPAAATLQQRFYQVVAPSQ
jgi:hypothetical protein